MRNVLYVAFVVVLALGPVACSTDSAPDATAQPTESGAAPAASASSSPARPAAAPAPARPAAPRTFSVPEGTELTVVLIDSISTGKNKAGDEFSASLAEPIVVGGQTVAERGARVTGRIVDAESSGRVSGRASIRMVLTSITDGAKTYPIVTAPFVAEAEGTKARDAGIIGAGAGIGAAIGAIAGGGSGAAKGAVIGGAGGTGAVLATKGKELEYDSESRLKFTLEKAASLPKIVS